MFKRCAIVFVYNIQWFLHFKLLVRQNKAFEDTLWRHFLGFVFKQFPPSSSHDASSCWLFIFCPCALLCGMFLTCVAYLLNVISSVISPITRHSTQTVWHVKAAAGFKHVIKYSFTRNNSLEQKYTQALPHSVVCLGSLLGLFSTRVSMRPWALHDSDVFRYCLI